VTSVGRCPAIFEVTVEPRWNPGRVDREARRGEGDRWGVLTEVRGLYALGLNEAPAVEEIGVPRAALVRKGHLELEEWQYLEAEHRIRGSRPRARRTSPDHAQIPLEQGEVEGYDVIPPRELRRAFRREVRLVRDYAAHLMAQGDTVSRNALTPDGERNPMYTDAFNQTRNQLIEATARTCRNDIRMAIGQLADYA
jgi:hypothetical protein